MLHFSVSRLVSDCGYLDGGAEGIKLTDDKLIIDGSYHVSIWLRNMWEVDIRDMKYHRWRIRLDSNVDAVQIKFRTEEEFEDFSEKLIKLTEQFENVKLVNSVYN